MSRLSVYWIVLLTGSLGCTPIVTYANNFQRTKPLGQLNPLGGHNFDPLDDGWVEIDDKGFPIESSSTRSLAPVANKLPGFIQALNNGEFGPNSPFQVLQASDGSVVYLVPGRRPMDKIPTEQDITVNEIFRLFDRLNQMKESRGRNSMRHGQFRPPPPSFELSPFPLPPPRMPTPFFAPQIPPFLGRMPFTFGPPRQPLPWMANFPFPPSPINGPPISKGLFNFANRLRPVSQIPFPDSPAESSLIKKRRSITAPVKSEKWPRVPLSTETFVMAPRIGKSDQRKSWFTRPRSFKKPDGKPRESQFSGRPLGRY